MSRYEGSRQPPDVNDLYSLKIDNIKYSTQPDDLERAFRKFGEIGDIYIPRDPNTQEARGFGFVRFYSKHDAEDALDAMDGREIDGREIRVAFAAEKGVRGRGRGRGRGRDGYSQGGSRGYGRGSYDRPPGRGYDRDDYGHGSRSYERGSSRDDGRRRSPPHRSRRYSRSPDMR